MPNPARPDGKLPAGNAFLVERYVSASAAEDLPSSIARLARLCAADDAGVRYLHSAYLPADDTCFCLFSAATADAIAAINDRAQFPLHRITAATILLAPPEPPDPR